VVPGRLIGLSDQPASAVRRAALVTHGRAETIGPALARLRGLAKETGVDLLIPHEEVAKHGLSAPAEEVVGADLVVVLGGDGTMLRALQRFLGTGIPVIGVNFGRVGFLTTIPADELESGLARVFAGEYRTIELATIEVDAGDGGIVGVNDVVATSAELGRMVELEWAIGDESLGRVACDGIICATPAGSTAYNLSNGGPVLVWGLDAMAVTFVAPHSLHARPLVVPRSRDLTVWNRTVGVFVTVLVDGHAVSDLQTGESVTIRLGASSALLATLPEATFFRRYRQVFAS
jgi:NAD+ kinase